MFRPPPGSWPPWGLHRRRRGAPAGSNPAVYWMAVQALVQFLQLPRKPPVTAALILANVAIHWRLGPLDASLPEVEEVCLNPATFVKHRDLKRLLLSAFFHVDDVHLIYNMVSLLWKGVHLEAQLGSAAFARTVATLLLLSHSLIIPISYFLSSLLSLHSPYYHDCSVGFSAVLFALKTVLNASQPSYSNVGGFLIPSRYAAWAELLLIQLVVPRASFLGHLCGILAGLCFLNAPPSIPRFVQRFLSLLPLPRALTRRVWGSGRSGGGRSRRVAPTTAAAGRRESVGGSSRGASHREPSGASSSFSGEGAGGVWSCLACTFENSGYRDRCEMCETARGQRGPANEAGPMRREEREGRPDIGMGSAWNEENHQRERQDGGRGAHLPSHYIPSGSGHSSHDAHYVAGVAPSAPPLHDASLDSQVNHDPQIQGGASALRAAERGEEQSEWPSPHLSAEELRLRRLAFFSREVER